MQFKITLLFALFKIYLTSFARNYPQIYSFGGRDENDTFLASVSRLDSFTGEWQTIATMPTGRNQFCGAAIGTKFYLFGGLKGNHTKSIGSRTAEVYDCSTNTFTRLRSMPQRREGCGAAVLSELIYVASGWDGTNSLSSVIRYDVQTDQWSTVSSMNTSRVGLQLVQLGGYLFAVGGKGWNTVEKYDPTTDQWSFVASTQSKHQYSGATAHAGKLYVTSQNAFEIYDPETDQWTSMDSLSNHTYAGGSLVSMNGLLWAIGGASKDHKSVFSYNTPTGRWTRRLDMNVGRKLHVSLSFHPDQKGLQFPKLYVFGGEDYYTYLKSASRYDSASGEWQAIQSISPPRVMHCGVVMGDKIYLFGGVEKRGESFNTEYITLKDAQVYDCSTDTFTTLRSMPEERKSCGAAALDGYIYVTGGLDDRGFEGSRYYSSLIRYNIQLNQWSTLRRMKQGRAFFQLVELGGLLYAVGGELFNSLKAPKTEIYDATTDQWTFGAQPNSKLLGLSATVHEGKIYAFGSYMGNRFEVYSSSTNKWTVLNSTVDAEFLNFYHDNSIVSMNGRIWNFGGEYISGPTKRTYSYDPSTDQWTRQQDMDIPRKGHIVFVSSHS